MISISNSSTINNIYLFKNYHVVLTNNKQYTEYTAADFVNQMNAVNYINIVNKLMQYGYIIDPRALMDTNIYSFITNIVLPDIKSNYNSTFYQSWNDLVDKSDMELMVDQCLHYLSTYGTGYNGDSVYVPNDNPVELQSTFDKYTVIKFKTVEEQGKEFLDMLSTPVALSEDNLNCILNIIKIYLDNLYNTGININDIYNYINNIKNKEAKIVLAKVYSISLSEPSDMVRLISYIVTGKVNIVLNKDYLATFNYGIWNYRITRDILDKLFGNMSDDELKSLSQVYHRYHKMFKYIHKYGNKQSKNIINKLSRYAKKNHKPTVVGYWEKILSKDSCIAFINKYKDSKSPSFELYNKMEEDTKAGKFSCFKAIKLYNAVSERLNNIKYSFYYIRNNKMFIKDSKEITDEVQIKAYDFIKNASLYYVIKHFRDYLFDNNIKYIVMPDKANITYALPTSEKNFIGSVPMYSYIDLSKDSHNMIGIYWRNEWGTHDFDISVINSDGEKIGWNTSYKNKDNSVLFSGDMTDANPEATEIIYFNNIKPKDSWFFCNRFAGACGSKYRLFFSQEHACGNFGKNYMVDPNNVLFSVDMVSEVREQSIGCVVDNKFVFTNINIGNTNTSTLTEYKHHAMDYINEAINSKYTLNILFPFVDDICKVVTVSEYEEIKKLEDEGNKYNILDLDFNNLTKDMFIKMFS